MFILTSCDSSVIYAQVERLLGIFNSLENINEYLNKRHTDDEKDDHGNSPKLLVEVPKEFHILDEILNAKRHLIGEGYFTDDALNQHYYSVWISNFE